MTSTKLKLSVMMFLQYFIWGSWFVTMGTYLGTTLGFSGAQIGLAYGATAIAALLTPFLMGTIADRFFPSEKMLAVLHLGGAGLIYAVSLQTDWSTFYPLLIVYALFYMPTLALTNSISFENIPSAEKDFPLIRVFGTLGWIAAGWVVGLVLRAGPDSILYPSVTSLFGTDAALLRPNSFFFMAAGASALLGLFCFALPHTPPKRKSGSASSGQRKSILNLLRERSFLVFVVSSFLICIPLAFYYNLANVFLQQTDAPSPTALQTVGQISEVGFMALMPVFIAWLGVKRLLAIGMLAWVLRYLFFGSLMFPLVFVGLLLHGVCYDFFFVGSQIYVDSKADLSQRASAQSFIAFVTLGVAMFVGALLAGFTMDSYPPQIQVTAIDAKQSEKVVPLPDWDPQGKTGLAAALNLGPNDTIRPEDLPEEFVDSQTELRYRKHHLAAALKKADRNSDGVVDRAEWRAAQAHDWFHIWLWPAVAAGATLAFFWLGFKDDTTRQAAQAS